MKKNFVLFGLIATLYPILLGENNPKLKVRSVTITGAYSLNSIELLSVIRTKPSTLFNNQYFDRRLAKFDAISLKTSYVSHGFLSASVKDSVVVKDEFVDIFFNIHEGNQVILKQAKVLDNNKLQEGQILKILALKTNNPYNPVDLNKNLPQFT